MASEEERAALAKYRGQISAQITDPAQRAKFVAQQGNEEAVARNKKQNLDELQKKQGEATANQTNRIVALGSFKHGGTVKKTGHYKLHQGEMVVPKHAVKKAKRAGLNFFGEPF